MKNIVLSVIFTLTLLSGYSQQHLYSMVTTNKWSTTDGGVDCGCTPTSTDTVTVSHNWANVSFYPLSNPAYLAFGNYIVTTSTDNPFKVIVKDGGVAYQTGTIPTGMVLVVESGGFWGYNGSTLFHGSDANAISSMTNFGTIVVSGSFTNKMTLTNDGEICKVGAWVNDVTVNASLNDITDANMDPFFTATNYGANCYEEPTVLPVELISFTAIRDGSEIKYNWTTASEVNNDYFEIMVSKDGITWESAMVISGVGTSMVTNDYSVSSDMLAYSYAKLKQADFDGTTSYSDIISLGKVKSSLTVFKSGLMVDCDKPQPYSVTDIRGRILINGVIPSGQQFININLTGMVLVTVGSETRRLFFK